MRKSTTINTLLIICMLGIVTSAYLIKIHYSTSSSAFCNFSQSVNCDIVNKSDYSLFPPAFGIPVAILGLAGFLAAILLLMLIRKQQSLSFFDERITPRQLSNILFYLFLISLVFAAYLLYIEAFILYSFCILCLLLDLLIVAALILSHQLKNSRPERPWELQG